MTLDEVLAKVARVVPYLRASTECTGDDWMSCETLVRDRGALDAVVRAAMSGLRTEDESVAASLFAQAYAFRVAGVALAAYALELPVPDVTPQQTSVRLDKPRPSAIAHLSARVHRGDADALARELIDTHFAPFVEAVHDRFTVGRRLLWGNVAASCATAFRAVEGASDEKRAIRDRAGAFIDAASPWFDGLGAFTTVRVGEHEGWFWDRTNCCLWYQTASGQLCDNCSLMPEVERHEARVRELSGADS